MNAPSLTKADLEKEITEKDDKIAELTKKLEEATEPKTGEENPDTVQDLLNKVYGLLNSDYVEDDSLTAVLAKLEDLQFSIKALED